MICLGWIYWKGEFPKAPFMKQTNKKVKCIGNGQAVWAEGTGEGTVSADAHSAQTGQGAV